jgi:hypothetical protein
MFSYEREIKESFKYVNTLKNGSYEEKQEVKEHVKVEQSISFEKQHSHGKSLFDVLLGVTSGGYIAPTPMIQQREERRKKAADIMGSSLSR